MPADEYLSIYQTLRSTTSCLKSWWLDIGRALTRILHFRIRVSIRSRFTSVLTFLGFGRVVEGPLIRFLGIEFTVGGIPWFGRILCTRAIAVTGCVFVLLLAKFAFMTWKKANVPEETTSNGGIETSSSMALFRDRTKTQPKFVNAESLCEFLQSAQLSRTGRRSRSSTSTVLKKVYNLGCYDQLTKDDLKNIGTFLGIPKLSKLQQKADLINAVVVQYETSLQSLNLSGIKEVLSVMNMNNIATTNKKDLVKLAIEIGF